MTELRADAMTTAAAKTGGTTLAILATPRGRGRVTNLCRAYSQAERLDL